MCLGGLFVPEAYITATRQYVAQANSWSLEELCLEVNVTTTQNAVLDACSFGVTGKIPRKNRGPCSQVFAEASGIKWAISNEKDPVTAKVNMCFLKLFKDQFGIH